MTYNIKIQINKSETYLIPHTVLVKNLIRSNIQQ